MLALSNLRSAVRGLSASRFAAPAAFARAFADDSALKKTVLYDMHVENGGKMVPFAGWSMPIQYKDSIMESTQWCRTNASLFDVSHMCGVSLKGNDAIKFLETLVVGDIASLKDGTGTLSVVTNEKGGAIDDTVITKVNDKYAYLVLNAGCRDKDLAHIEEHMAAFKGKGGDVSLEIHDERSVLAFQGPKAAGVLQTLTKDDLSTLYFGMFKTIVLNGISCWVTRTGYTGEDGFEISVPVENTVELTKAIVAGEGVRLCGLGARDSLRLEAGLCLYGNDLTQDITVLEAGLKWTIGKRRRENWDFVGGEALKAQDAVGITKRRVGFVTKGAPARQGSPIQTLDGKVVGEITSGGYSPNLKKNIAMGYVEKKHGKAGTELKVVVRGKVNDAVVTKMPFVTTTYYKG